MPQWRKLHVKATESLDINDMPDDFHRLLWVMLPLGLDCEGRGLDNPAWIKAKVMPLRTDISPKNVANAMNWYEQHGMIERYEVNGRGYFRVPTWHQYQGDTSREADSNYPPPPGTDCMSESGASQERVTSESSTDSDVDSDSDSPTEGACAPGGNGLPTNFKGWERFIRDAKGKKGGRPAALRLMCVELYPDHDPPDYGRLGKAARRVGGAGRLAELLWQLSTRPPTGDIVSYAEGTAKRTGGDGRGGFRSSAGPGALGAPAVKPAAEPVDEAVVAADQALLERRRAHGGS